MTKKTSKEKLLIIPALFLIIYNLLLILGGIYFPEWIWINMHSLAAWTAILVMMSVFIITGLNISNKKTNGDKK